MTGAERRRLADYVRSGTFDIGCTAAEAEGVVRRTREAIAYSIGLIAVLDEVEEDEEPGFDHKLEALERSLQEIAGGSPRHRRARRLLRPFAEAGLALLRCARDDAAGAEKAFETLCAAYAEAVVEQPTKGAA